jgi:hypothetical protein
MLGTCYLYKLGIRSAMPLGKQRNRIAFLRLRNEHYSVSPFFYSIIRNKKGKETESFLLCTIIMLRSTLSLQQEPYRLENLDDFALTDNHITHHN